MTESLADAKKTANVDPIIAWLDNLTDEIFELFHCLELFKFTRDEVLAKNPLILKGADTTYFDWIMRSSTVDMIIRVTCLCDQRPDTESLVCFLRALGNEPYYLSRDRFIKLYVGSGVEDFATRDFERLCGRVVTSFPVAFINSDIALLTNEEPFSKIKDHRNQWIAHLAKTKGDSGHYDDLFVATEKIEVLIKKYKLLLTGGSLLSATPTIQGNWQAVLQTPLI